MRPKGDSRSRSQRVSKCRTRHARTARLHPRPFPLLRRNDAAASSVVPARSDAISSRPAQTAVARISPASSPPAQRSPRWARRLERVANNAAAQAEPATTQVMERLRTLEDLVKELRGQLERANAAVARSAAGSSGVNSPEGLTHDRDIDHQRDRAQDVDVQGQFGRLVLQDHNRSRYVSSRFWSRVNDELDGLKIDGQHLDLDDSDSSEDESSPGQSSSTQELDRTPADRHAFLFRHNLSPTSVDLREFHPLPSQIPYFLDVFSENINSIIRIVHAPTVAKMIRDLRGKPVSSLTPSHEALLFAIYYATVTSMEEEEITANFGMTKTDLNLKYRLGLERALAKADFLNAPNLVLLQALAIFLCVGRRHDSPRFVWMMTGLAIRMAQALGLQRDGARFTHLTPYEIEMRRRAWWALCLIDVRASEDQGTDYTIAYGSFDTKLPLNVNDADFGPETIEMPPAREGLTDMTFPLVSYETCNLTKEMMTRSVEDGVSSIEEQGRLLGEIYAKLDRGYLQYSVESDNMAYWAAIVITRLVMAKMTLLIYLPILAPSAGAQFSEATRAKLFVAAIEIAEYNHALNAEPACRHWRWVFQTYTHWYAVVFLLLEINRRAWSPLVERAWVALHSKWLIPAQSHVHKDLSIWIPLRKLMAKARKHRGAEIERLRSNPQGAEQLEIEDRALPVPSSSGPFPDGSDAVHLFAERRRQLIRTIDEFKYTQKPAASKPNTEHSGQPVSALQSHGSSFPACSMPGSSASLATFDSSYPDVGLLHGPQDLTSNVQSFIPSTSAGNVTLDQAPATRSNEASFGPGFVPWLLDDSFDVNMDLDGDVNWLDWLDSTRSVE